MKELKQSELKELRQKWYDEQNGIDPILEEFVNFEDTVLDHIHTKKGEEANDENGRGYCRGVIQRDVNAFEGRILSAYKRSGLEKHISLTLLLKNLADYYTDNHFTNGDKYIHVNSIVKKKITKRCYNKLKKVIDGQVKIPNYGKGKLTKGIEKLFIRFNVDIEFYS